jgi:Ca-activated chloride channel family protein
MKTLAGIVIALVAIVRAPQAPAGGQGFTFRSAVELINVTATVTDAAGRFVPGLQQSDFRVSDDGQLQTLTHFSAERVPVSLGILLDTSGSMAGEKIDAARAALNRFLTLLTDPADEVFLYRFDNQPELVQDWTTDKRLVSASLGRLEPRGATALYDTVADAIDLSARARNRKKALVIISDGNDTSSRTDVVALKQMIRESEVLIYAVGIDSPGGAPARPNPSAQRGGTFRPPQPPSVPTPSPFPGGRKPPAGPPPNPTPPPSAGSSAHGYTSEDRVNVAALRDITDDSGGRTEIIRAAQDLDPATAGIADELSKQYYMGYPAPPEKDGRWHTIKVEVRQPAYHVRARKGYVAGK